jgi:hypothetical protein
MARTELGKNPQAAAIAEQAAHSFQGSCLMRFKCRSSSPR